MRIHEEIMYHISTRNDWKKGDTIISGNQDNPFWNQCKDIDWRVNVNNRLMTICEMFESFQTFDVTQNNIDFLYKNLKDGFTEAALYIREQVFEAVRLHEYPELPSRQKCLWVTQQDQVPYWRTMHNRDQVNLLTLRLNGDIFCGDDHWLKADTLSSIVYEQRARHYWAGEMHVTPRKEFLFSGEATIIETAII